MYKVSKTARGLKINQINVGDVSFLKEEKKVARIIDGRPEKIRDTWITEVTADFYIDLEILSSIVDFEINMNQDEFYKKIKNTCPQCYSNGRSNSWTSSCIAKFLNEVFNTNSFM